MATTVATMPTAKMVHFTAGLYRRGIVCVSGRAQRVHGSDMHTHLVTGVAADGILDVTQQGPQVDEKHGAGDHANAAQNVRHESDACEAHEVVEGVERDDRRQT